MLKKHRSIFGRAFVFLAPCLCLAAGPASADSKDSIAPAELDAPAFKVLALYRADHDDAHIDFDKEAAVWFQQVASLNNFSYTQSTNWDLLNNLTASQYQVVMFLDAQPGSSAQKAGFQRYMENGGAFFGFHVTAYNDDTDGIWPWFHQTFLGTGKFNSNTWFPTTAEMKVDNRNHPSTLRLPAVYTSAVCEWYSWQYDLRQNSNITILASVDPSSFPLGNQEGNIWRSGYYPIMWTNKNYKMLYANFGHNAMNYGPKVGLSSTFGSEDQNHFIVDGLLWLAGQARAGAVPQTGPSPTAWYSLTNRASNKCVEARNGSSANGTAIQQSSCTSAQGQQFQIQNTGKSFSRINNRLNAAQSLDVAGVSQADNAPVQLWSYSNGNNQQWRLVNQFNGYYRIVSKHSSKCLTVPNGSTADGVQLVQMPCTGVTSQDFKLTQK
ncbi:RICIN domain-containing protein [Pendulispora brunnea]|uniref:RICIN domain-containing protein n=1 Tax=Pendulispora brunnea TaxID=2905690 RepID=A0ABZ2KC42_9BACT